MFRRSLVHPIDQIAFLQRTVGNRGMGQLLRSRIIQAKLKVNKPGDVYEREADRISDQVQATQTPALVSGAPGIQRVVAQPVAETASAPASVERALASAGKPLDPTIQREMEQRFGQRLFAGSRASRPECGTIGAGCKRPCLHRW